MAGGKFWQLIWEMSLQSKCLWILFVSGRTMSQKMKNWRRNSRFILFGGRGHGLMSHDPDIPWGSPTPGSCLSTRRRRVLCGRSSECTGHYPSVRDLPSFSPQWPQASEPAGPETCCPLRLGSSSESATRHCMLVRICLSYTISSSNMCFNKTLLNLFPKGAALTRTKCKQPYCYLKLSCGTILILSLSVLSF